MRKVFVVDDEEELLDIYTSVLSGTYELRAFLKPEDMMEAVKGGDIPDVFITDLNMPKINGAELLVWVRKEKIKKPAILISGFSDKPQVSTALKLGSVQVLEKPFSIDLFKSVVRGAVLHSVYQQFHSGIFSRFRSAVNSLSALEKHYEPASFSITLKEIQGSLREFSKLEHEIENLMNS